MNHASRFLIAYALLALLITGCKDHISGAPHKPVATSVAPVTDAWLGKWLGPEGTFLQLTSGNGKYEITIQNLDGLLTFQGIAAGNQIEFERNGMKEFLRATNGAETGMKWLSEKSNCLTVRSGEGYCRD